MLEIGERLGGDEWSLGDDPATEANFAVMGRYFYRGRGAPILLGGSRQPDDSIVLREYRGWSAERETGDLLLTEKSYLKATGGTWRITFSKEKAAGIFCKCDLKQPALLSGDPHPEPPAPTPTPGVNAASSANTNTEPATAPVEQSALDAPAPASLQKLPITLTLDSKGIDPMFGDLDAGDSRRDHRYVELLLDFPLKEGPEVRISDEIAYVVQSDPRFNVSAPRLTRFPDAAIMATINEEFSGKLNDGRTLAARYSQGENFKGGEWEQADNVTFMTRDLLNLVSTSSWFLTAMAHPETSRKIYTYDLHSGELFSFWAYFDSQIDPALLKEPGQKKDDDPGEAPLDSEADSERVDALLIDLYLRHFEMQPEHMAQCSRLVGANVKPQMLLEIGPVWLDQHGLAIGMSMNLSRADQVCGPDIIVPFREVIPLLKKESSLRAMFEALPDSEKK